MSDNDLETVWVVEVVANGIEFDRVAFQAATSRSAAKDLIRTAIADAGEREPSEVTFHDGEADGRPAFSTDAADEFRGFGTEIEIRGDDG